MFVLIWKSQLFKEILLILSYSKDAALLIKQLMGPNFFATRGITWFNCLKLERSAFIMLVFTLNFSSISKKM